MTTFIKSYTSEATATAVAAKKSKGDTQYEVVPNGNQFQVQPVGYQPEATTAEVPDFTANLESDDTAELDATVHASESKEAAAEGDDLITVNIPGARITAKYVITPAIGQSKKGPVERWFELERIQSAKNVEGGVQMVLSAKAFKSRKIDVAKYEVVSA